MTDRAAPAGLRWLPRFLFRPERWPAYVGKAWLLALLPSLALAAAVSWLFPGVASPEFGSAETPVSRTVLGLSLVLIGPFVETLVMGGWLLLLRRFVGFAPAVLLSALSWGLLHSFGALLAGGPATPAWGLVVWWPFLILSIAFLAWRERGFWTAIGTATLIHGLQNAVAAAALFAS